MVTRDDLFAWLRAHEIDPSDVRGIEFVPESVLGGEVRMRVTLFARNTDGGRFMCRSAFCGDHEHAHGGHPAQETRWVPLRSLPGLGAQVA